MERESAPFIYDILTELVSDDYNRSKLMEQISFLQIKGYNYTGWGVFVKFDNSNIPEQSKLANNVMLAGLLVESEEVNSPNIEAILITENGVIDYLEIDSVAEGYPHKNLTKYTLVKGGGSY